MGTETITTTVEAVERHIEMDAPLADTLARGIANVRRTARWLIEEHDWDASEEAVVSAIRRYAERYPTAPLTRERKLLNETQVDIRTGLALITVSRGYTLHEGAPDLWATMRPYDVFGVLPSRRRFRFLVEKKSIEAVQERLPAGVVKEIVEPVAAIKLALPGSNREMGVMSQVVGALIHRGIDVHEVVTCLQEVAMVVAGRMAVQAYEVAAALTKGR